MARSLADLAALDGAAVLFDLDGTLVDTAPDLVGALNVALAAANHPPLPLETARPMIGRGGRWMLQKGFEAAGDPLTEARTDVLFEAFLDHYRAHIADESRPFPGIEAALDRLAAAGARLAVCTNKRTELSIALLDALGMTSRFDAVIGADLAPAIKPDPRHLLAAMQAVGGRIERTLMVGDAATDAGSARAAGAGLILVSFGYTEVPAAELDPDILLHHFDDLPEACLRLLSRLPGAA